MFISSWGGSNKLRPLQEALLNKPLNDPFESKGGPTAANRPTDQSEPNDRGDKVVVLKKNPKKKNAINNSW